MVHVKAHKAHTTIGYIYYSPVDFQLWISNLYLPPTSVHCGHLFHVLRYLQGQAPDVYYMLLIAPFSFMLTPMPPRHLDE
jgi:hypothetical protein